MKYYSEETVRKIASDAEKIAFLRQCGVKTEALEIGDYSSIEISDKHGRIIDEKWVELYILKYFSIEFPNDMEKVYKLLKSALKDVPTILEATE